MDPPEQREIFRVTMGGLGYFSISFFVSLACFVIGYLAIGSARGWRLGGDTVLMFLAIIGAAFAGFVAGFYGPIYWSPGSSQGPLLGIFLTGPLGAVVGLVASVIYILRTRKRSEEPSHDV